MHLLFTALAIVALFAVLFVFRTKFEPKKALILKIIGFVLLAVVFVESFGDDGFVGVINGGEIYGHVSHETDVLETLIRWVTWFSEVLIFALLVVDSKPLKSILSFVCLPLCFLSLAYFQKSITYYTEGIQVADLYLIPRPLNAVLHCVETVLLLVYLLYLAFDWKSLLLHGKEEWRPAIKLGVIGSLVCIPLFTFPSLFGETSIEVSFLSPAHFGWIASIAVVYCVIYFLFRKEDYVTRKSVIAMGSFYLFLHFFASFRVGYSSNRLPFQLCNLAACLFPLLLFVNFKPLFSFIYVANPVGALIAIVTLSDTGNAFSFWIIHYLIEHLYVFILPILMASLGIYERPSFKRLLRDYFIVFSCYFLFCFLFNAIHNGVIVAKWGSGVINATNFFYLVECPVKDVLPFYKDLEVLPFHVFGQTYYAVYVLFIYVVFSALAFLLYFIQQGCFALPKFFKKKTA